MSKPEFTLRPMAGGEELALWRLFHQTIHSVNRQDYSPAQLAAWSPEDRDMQQWRTRLSKIKPFVVTTALSPDGSQVGQRAIVGFSDLQADGLIDFLFVHHTWQGRGVASLILAEIERRAQMQNLPRLYAHVSITAQPFFLAQGFEIVEKRVVQINGVSLSNAVMQRWL